MSFISHCYNDRKESLLTLLHLVSILLDYELPRYPIIAIDGSDDIRSFGKTHQTALIQIGHLKSIPYRTVESYDIATIAFQIIQMQIAGVIIDTDLTRTYRLIADRPGRGRERFTIECAYHLFLSVFLFNSRNFHDIIRIFKSRKDIAILSGVPKRRSLRKLVRIFPSASIV